MAAGRDSGGQLKQEQLHCRDVAPRQDQARGLAVPGADLAEDVGGCRALVMRCRGTRTPPGPSPSDLVLLADAGLVAEPDLYVGRAGAELARDRRQARGEVFLNASIAPSAWAWWRGRAVSLR